MTPPLVRGLKVVVACGRFALLQFSLVVLPWQSTNQTEKGENETHYGQFRATFDGAWY